MINEVRDLLFEGSNYTFSDFSILIVDDDFDLLNYYKKLLSILGFKSIDVADNGLEAVNKYKQQKIRPDIILMDIQMPKMNGIDASKIILEIDPDANIIIISGDSQIEEDYVLSIGVKGFIKKSFKINDLLQILIKILK